MKTRPSTSPRCFVRIRISNGIFASPLPPSAPAGGRCSRAAIAVPPARGGRTPQAIAARRGAAMRGLDMRLRMRDAEGSGVFPVRGPRSGSSGKAGGGRFQTAFQATKGRNTPPRRARRLWAYAGVGFVEREEFLATTGRGNGRWHGGQLEVTQDARDHRLLGDGGNDPQGATAAQRTGGHIQSKDAAQQSSPVPIRSSRFRCIDVDTLLGRCRNDRRPELAVRR